MSLKRAANDIAEVEDISAAKKKRRAGGPTATSNFGTSRRESHDASGFYQRFTPPELSTDETIERNPEEALDVIHCADARFMSQVKSNSVALVVTSPPYFAGKAYEEDLSADGVPSTYFEYLELLTDVFAECKRVLEPGGRIAVNVANLGRRPYRSLAGDVAKILEDLGLLMRGEVVWWKGKAAGGSCAWGTFQRPNNPVLRDVTERIVIASKGRFDRALSAKDRETGEFPSVTTITRDEFLEATTDLWEIPPESARRVNHPAPFPVELPKRLIELYTYKDDVVLDPFMGSGSTGVAAVRTDRRFIGFDTDDNYVQAAMKRIEEERSLAAQNESVVKVSIPARPLVSEDEDFQTRSIREGRQAKDVAIDLLRECGFTNIASDVKLSELGIEVNLWATDAHGEDWAFDVSGAFTTTRAGLRRTEALWKALAKAAIFRTQNDVPYVLLTTDAPKPGSPGFASIQQLMDDGAVFDVIELLNLEDQKRLTEYCLNGNFEADE